MPLPGQTLADLQVITTDPAAGANLLYIATSDMVIYSFVVTLVTSAVVNNRGFVLQAMDASSNIFYTGTPNATSAASTTTIISGISGCPNLTTINGICYLTLPAMGLHLQAGDKIVSNTLNLDAGDNYSAMVMRAEML